MRRIVSIIGAFGVVVAFAPAARAGALSDAEWCYADSNGGSCQGNAFGFAANSGSPNDFATFDTDITGSGGPSGYFEAIYNGSYYYCGLSTEYYGVVEMWPQTLNLGSGYQLFTISWDANGNCNYLDYEMNTSYRNPG